MAGRKMEGFGNSANFQRDGDIHNKPAPKGMWHALSRLGSTVVDVAMPASSPDKRGYEGEDVKTAAKDVARMMTGVCQKTNKIELVSTRLKCGCAGCKSFDNAAELKKVEERNYEYVTQLRHKQNMGYKEVKERYLPTSWLKLDGNKYKVVPPGLTAAVAFRLTPNMNDKDLLNSAIGGDWVEGEEHHGATWLKITMPFNVKNENTGRANEQAYSSYCAPSLVQPSTVEKPKGPWGAKPATAQKESESSFAFVNALSAEETKPDPTPSDLLDMPTTEANNSVDLLGGDGPAAHTPDLLGGAFEGQAAQQQSQSITDLLMAHTVNEQDDLIGIGGPGAVAVDIPFGAATPADDLAGLM